VSRPGSGWGDQSCAAWTIGGPLATGGMEWALLGVILAGGNSYDLRAYQGFNVLIESGADVLAVVKTLGGGYFGQWLTATGSNSQTRSVTFSSMFVMDNSSEAVLDTAQVTELQFSPENPIGFGFAIHLVLLRPL
jgi:hypothetical protein